MDGLVGLGKSCEGDHKVVNIVVGQRRELTDDIFLIFLQISVFLSHFADNIYYTDLIIHIHIHFILPFRQSPFSLHGCNGSDKMISRSIIIIRVSSIQEMIPLQLFSSASGSF